MYFLFINGDLISCNNVEMKYENLCTSEALFMYVVACTHELQINACVSLLCSLKIRVENQP